MTSQVKQDPNTQEIQDPNTQEIHGWTGRKTAERARQARYRKIEKALPATVIVLGVLLWMAVAFINEKISFINPVFFPGPVKVFETGWEMLGTGELQANTWASLRRVLIGFVVASAFGVMLGALAGRNRWASAILDTLVSIMRPVPPIALLPIMVVWLGIGELSKVIFIAYAAFFSVFLTTYQGVRTVDPVLLRAADSLGASRRTVFRRVILPSSLPHIFTGLRLGFTMAFFVIVAAEFIGADKGLGSLIFSSRVYFEVDKMLVAAVTIGILGFIFDWTMSFVERRLFTWR